ncbi:MAG: YcaQ family DNA glycosylase [Ignavibacteria bacterium]|nr:YcaQ family DNA glycosylase [Ignavibacteria bacterium]
MSKKTKITLSEARQLAIASQLQFNTNRAKPVAALQKIIERLGYVQIDTISIVERAHKHILWTRLPEFKNEMLDELIDKKRKVFEFWDHAAAYLPMKHFRFTLPRKEMYAKKYKHWASGRKKLLDHIVNRIREEGPLQSRDFEDPKKRGLWWDWKPAKEGLEYLFHTGVLSAKARKSFQKVYDLTERILPPDTDTSHPTELEQAEHLILKSVAANGFASQKEMFYLRYHSRPAAKQALLKLEEEKKIVPLGIEGAEGETYYTMRKNLARAINSTDDVHILSPFDNLVIQRKRLNTIFNFDYTIECYVPAPKRRFGYFCMPVLFNGEFICRIDAKADRASNTLRVINIFWEDTPAVNRNRIEINDRLLRKLESLAQFAGCETVLAEQLK